MMFKKIIASAFLGLGCFVSQPLQAQQSSSNDTLFITFKDGSLLAYPQRYVARTAEEQQELAIYLTDQTRHHYPLHQIAHRSTKAPSFQGKLTEMHFLPADNRGLATETHTHLQGDTLTAQVPVIGKWLTPTFTLSDTQATLYWKSQALESGTSRLSFADPLSLTVALPHQQVLYRQKTKDEVWSHDNDQKYLPIDLHEEMISTNAPSNKPETEGLGKLLDHNPNTYFHSTWGQGAHAKLPIDEAPYLTFHLAQPISTLHFTYTTRSDKNINPLAIVWQVSTDGKDWQDVAHLTTKDGLPTMSGASYSSPNIDLKGEYSLLRMVVSKSSYKNYLCLSEFALFTPNPKAEGDNHLISPAEYEYQFQPLGNTYVINLQFPTGNKIPRIEIDVENGAMVLDKVNYLNAKIRINGAGLYPDFEGDVTIKGRGNSSWTANNPNAKNPYRLKFEKKTALFGQPKAKSWVLLANKINGSLLCNAIGMKVANLVQTPGANQIIPVELFLNGDYRGTYDFTAKVGFSKNSVDFKDDKKGALLELDTYYDEDFRFRSNYYHLPVNIKEPDYSKDQPAFSDQDIQDDFNQFCEALYHQEPIGEYVDIDYLTRYLLVNDLIANFEIHHPKSTYLYKEDVLGHSKYIFGPIWDLDWAFGYEHGHNYAISDAETDFWTATDFEAVDFTHALRYGDPATDKQYFFLWDRFVKTQLQELIDFCDTYYQYVRPAIARNAERWGDYSDYQTIARNMQTWLQKRANYIYSHLTPYTPDPTPGPVGITTPTTDTPMPERVDVFTLSGVKVASQVPYSQWHLHLSPGIYIVGGQKRIITH